MTKALRKREAEVAQAEAALRESEVRYRGLFENSPISLWEEDFSAVKNYIDDLKRAGVTDLRAYFQDRGEALRHCAAMTRVIDVNSATLELLRYESKDELLGELVHLFRPESYHVFREELVSLAEGNRAFVTEVGIYTRYGDKIYVSLGLTVMPGHENTWARVLTSLTDITEQAHLHEQVQRDAAELERRVIQATAEIRRRADELTTLYDVSRDLVATLDLETLLPTIAQRVADTVKADRCAVFLFDQRAGVLRARAAHGYMAERLTGFDYRSGEEIVGQAYARVESQYIPDLDLAPDLPRRDAIRAVLAVPLVSPTADPLGVLSVASLQPNAFTSDQQRLLETMASQIAAAVENARLYEAAQEADRLKSAFLATMSHELRTPLNSIIGFTGIILQGLAGPLNEEQTKQLNMVLNSARHLLDLINDVLDISKIEAGQLEIAARPFDMREVIAQAVRTVTPLSQKKGLSLVAEVAPEVGPIVSDRRRVEQILINLLNNAIKFTDEGQVCVQCQAGDDWLVTRVVDTGIGIQPHDLDKLFKPFRQVETGITRRHEGTGLGLSICKKLIEMLGGEIWVESEWTVGSTFTFTLPLQANTGGKDGGQDPRH